MQSPRVRGDPNQGGKQSEQDERQIGDLVLQAAVKRVLAHEITKEREGNIVHAEGAQHPPEDGMYPRAEPGDREERKQVGQQERYSEIDGREGGNRWTGGDVVEPNDETGVSKVRGRKAQAQVSSLTRQGLKCCAEQQGKGSANVSRQEKEV